VLSRIRPADRLRLRIDFASFAGHLPGQTTCSPSVGPAQSFTARGSRFHTSAGLRVGDRSSSISPLYPEGKFRHGSWWLVTAVSPFGDESEYAVVGTLVGGGRLHAIVGWVGAGGDYPGPA
jgi:hypothetical protein